MSKFRTIGSDQFARLFACATEELHPETMAALARADTRHRAPTAGECMEHVMNYLPVLRQEWVARDAEANRAAWEKGWAESLRTVLARGPSAESCKPGYFRGSKFFRFDRDIVVTPNPQLEHDLFVAARQHLFRKFLAPFKSLHEFGSGSGGNLWMLQEIFTEKKIRGYDWVEPAVQIADEIGRRTGRDVAGERLDMLHPPQSLDLGSGAAVLTIHALEQLGTRHDALLDMLLRSRPGLVLHYEPFIELYDERVPFDFLARWYSEKRGYLSGLLSRLRELRDAGRIEILWEHRPALGGVLHEASVLVWRPV